MAGKIKKKGQARVLGCALTGSFVMNVTESGSKKNLPIVFSNISIMGKLEHLNPERGFFNGNPLWGVVKSDSFTVIDYLSVPAKAEADGIIALLTGTICGNDVDTKSLFRNGLVKFQFEELRANEVPFILSLRYRTQIEFGLLECRIEFGEKSEPGFSNGVISGNGMINSKAYDVAGFFTGYPVITGMKH